MPGVIRLARVDSVREIRSDEARRTLRDILDEIEHDGEHVTVLRYQRPAVVMVPVEWYQKARAALSEGVHDGAAPAACAGQAT